MSKFYFDEKEYLSLASIAEKYGYTKDHVGWLARSGRIKAIRRGKYGQWFVLESSLKDYQVSLTSPKNNPSREIIKTPSSPAPVLSPALLNEGSSSAKQLRRTNPERSREDTQRISASYGTNAIRNRSFIDSDGVLSFMPESERGKILAAMFDIRPIGNDGNFDINKVSQIKPALRLVKEIKKEQKERPLLQTGKPTLEEFEKYLGGNLNIKKELISIGARMEKIGFGRPRYKLDKKPQVINNEDDVLQDDYKAALDQIKQKVLPRDGNEFIGEPKKIDPINLGIVSQASYIKESPDLYAVLADYFKKPLPRSTTSRSLKPSFLAAGAISTILGIIFYFGSYGFQIKSEIVQEGASAATSLESAKEKIKSMNFVAATNDFAAAYKAFSKAGDNLDFMGSGLGALIADLPGAGKLRSARNILQAGKLIADAGQSMSMAVGQISKTSSIFNPNLGPSGLSPQMALASMEVALENSKSDLIKAHALLSDVDSSIIPQDKRTSFDQLNQKLPEFIAMTTDAIGYTKFLEDLIGSNGTKKYLILFQNPSELRPTGGFAGTYGVVTFTDGKLSGFTVDDIYNLDGQLKDNVVPPIQLQHITPIWGMRDAGWFIDFPKSAEKVSEFFSKESGYSADGVITIDPVIIESILNIVGPVPMLDYGFTLNSDNFLTILQKEVEYGPNRIQPKKVLVDMAPRLLEKLYSADASKWSDIFNIFISGLGKKDIMMFFRDQNLENFVISKDFSGKVHDFEGDYLMATITNVKGSKTDKETDTSIKVESRFDNGKLINKVMLTRKHNGGSSKYGFYNKSNPAYVRVLVPDGSGLISISGNDSPHYQPLVNYSKDFNRDDDLSKLESGYYMNANGAVTYREAGKTGIGFWMITDPGQTKTATFEYSVPLPLNPNNYHIYIQKQPGLELKKLTFSLNGATLYDGKLDNDLMLKAGN